MGAIFTIKIKDNFSNNLAISLAKNIINIQEPSFHSFSAMKSNEYILFSFFASPGMEKKFFGNLINFIKIIKLNNLYNKDANILEEIVPIKMIQFAKNFRITYNILNKQLKIEKSIYSVEARIRVYELKIKANQY